MTKCVSRTTSSPPLPLVSRTGKDAYMVGDGKAAMFCSCVQIKCHYLSSDSANKISPPHRDDAITGDITTPTSSHQATPTFIHPFLVRQGTSITY
ncbi:hypothetical protein JTE90_022292 [Oedothorax gibbosus]|uniref:Uncharacterized protein n=1 Tax=Oedothorax gibbosus TaxID=931172 RepID=A0AAV6VVI4_9ARAC|nr:hypothetical protein JTE90_022292 [Oedothorax gibbosus]